MRALQVIPWPVKLRVSLVLSVLVIALVMFLFWLRTQPVLLLMLGTPLLILGGYAGWCRWPRWRWGISPSLLAECPQPPQQLVRLTFDDGPTPGVTEQVLALLQKHQLKASFFVLLPKALQAPHLITQMVQEGHVVALHGADHRLPFLRKKAELTDSLQRAKQQLETLTGHAIHLYRPSHGCKNAALLAAVRTAKLQLCFWDYGVWDTDAPPPEVLLRRLQAVTPTAGSNQPGPVVLLHDGKGDDPQVPVHAPGLIAALAMWLPLLRK